MDTLVVGQGIAGSLVAFMLHLHKVPFVLIDPGEINTSSRIAAGMFTPVSGKRNTIGPHVLQKIQFAIETYKSIEQLLEINILHQANIYHVHNAATREKELAGKLAVNELANYIIVNPGPAAGIRHNAGAFEVTHSGWVDCEQFINCFALWLKQHDAFLEERFVYNDLQINSGEMEYHGKHFSNIIFCEGYRARHNPFFSEEQIIPCKGDILTIRCDELPRDRVIKKDGIYIIPVIENIFRVGSTYQWHNNNAQPDEQSRKQIEELLDGTLEYKYTVINHQSGIRPTTPKREVIAKQHPIHRGMFMLNGLGTKGILHGPWWSRFLVELLLSKHNAWLVMLCVCTSCYT